MSVAIDELEPSIARPAPDQDRHRALLKIARNHSGMVAWPTVIAIFGAMLGVSLSSWAATAGIWPFWAAMLLNGYLFLTLFMGVHDAIHKAICGDDQRYEWMNDAIGWVCGIIILVPYRAYDYMHMIHHRYTNDPERDPDYWCRARSIPVLFFKAATLKINYISKLRELGLHKTPDGNKRFWIGNYHDLALVSALVSGLFFGWAYEVFMLWLMPVIINIALITVFFNWLPHHPHTSQERYHDSGVFLLPQPLQWFVTRLNMFQNYHLVHHLFPRIPFYRLEKAFWEMRPHLEAEHAPIHDFQK